MMADTLVSYIMYADDLLVFSSNIAGLFDILSQNKLDDNDHYYRQCCKMYTGSEGSEVYTVSGVFGEGVPVGGGSY